MELAVRSNGATRIHRLLLIYRSDLMYLRDVVIDDVSPPAILALVADPHRWQMLAELRNAGLVTARRSSADRRDVYYRADLLRCRDLLTEAGGALHPGLRLAPPSTPLDGLARGRTRRVLFLCTGNSARSQIAEALLVERSGHTVDARSAGSHPKPLHDNAVRVMAERGIDIAGNTTKHLRQFARMRFDRLITLCDKVREICPDFPGAAATAHWSIADPATAGDTDDATYPAFRHVADELEGRVDLLVAELVARSTERTSHAR